MISVYHMRTWRNWQTRRFQVPVGNTVWVQIPSSAPEKLYQNDTAFIQTESLVCNHSVAMYGIGVAVWHFSLMTCTPNGE